MEIAVYALVVLNALTVAVAGYILYKYDRIRKDVKTEYYTDFRYGNLTMRVFKHEFEYQAIGNLKLLSILDRGTLNPFYDWALIQN